MISGGKRSIRLTAAFTGDEAKAISVTIPRGIADGAILRVRGAGRPGPTDSAPPGDLLLTVAVQPHPVLKRGRPETPAQEARSSRDLWLDLPVTIAEAALGSSVRVPAVVSERLSWATLTVPSATASGRTFRLKGRGVGGGGASDEAGAEAGAGDLYVRIRIVPPSAEQIDTSPDLRAALETIAREQPTPRGGDAWS